MKPMSILWLGSAILCSGLPAMETPSKLEMREASIHLGEKILKISLPDVMVRDGGDFPAERTVDLGKLRSDARGFHIIIRRDHDVNGPFWAGAYATLTVHIFIVKKPSDENREISDLESLYAVLNSDYHRRSPHGPSYTARYGTLGGRRVVVRVRDTFTDNMNTEPERRELYSFPLGPDLFLDIGFSLKCWEPGLGKERRWMPELQAYLHEIKQSVSLIDAKNGG